MNQHLQSILSFIRQSEHLTDEEKTALSKAAKDAAKDLDITAFKLDRTEKVKRTTAILLEETIEELENKRKAVEAQNRELEIESSLERVRTIAMSMNKADDMLEVCKIISQQLELLNVKEIRNVQTAIFYKDKGTYMNYEYYTKHDKTFITETTYNNNKRHAEFAEQMQKGNGQFFEMNINGDEVKEWIAYQKTTNVFIDDFLYDATSLNYYWHSLGPVALGISTYQPLKKKENDFILFKRFLKVFELAYRRYLDIEKAEAQAREAKIEAALEKVRSRSLAMHKSDEIGEVIWIIIDKMKELNIDAQGISLVTFIDDSNDVLHWYANAEIPGTSTTMLLPMFDDPICNDCVEAREKGMELFAKVYSKEEKNNYFNYAVTNTDFKNMPEDVKQWVREQPYLSFSYAIQKHSGIFLEDYTGKLFSKKDNDILIRLSKVFEQSYVRFLDLQKAEAQSRESQIQLALERARAQSMMMQHSKELDDTLRVFHEQVLQLDIPSAFSFLWLPDEEKDKHIFWAAWAENNSFKSKAINYPLDRNEPATKQCLIDWKSNEPVVTYHVPPDGVTNYFAAWSELIAGVDELKPEHFIDGLYYVEAFMKYGCFGVMVKSQLQEDEKKILERFATEFERAYTRFLDLQKAEAQTRESQIQLALERVRARTMAMHQSSELADTASILFQQIKELEFETWSCGFCIWAKNDLAEVWMAADSGGLLPPMMIPYKDEPTHAEIYKASLRGEPAHHKIWEGKELEKHYAFLKTIPSVKTAIDILEKSGLTLPSRQCYYVGFFKEGYLLLITKEPNEDLKDLSKRFASVFDLTYTRFLDLQKAEAQTRESQIQLALERVRARTMAMQKSDELADTSALLFRQFKDLGYEPDRITIGIMHEEKQILELWATSAKADEQRKFYELPFNEPHVISRVVKAWKEQKKSLVFVLYGQPLKEYTQFWKSLGAMQDARSMVDQVIFNFAFFSKGYLGFISFEHVPPQTIELLERFAGVFDLTYTRFLDLQKAEAQTREAQIETSLERIRARTIGMQKSNELQEIVALLYKECNRFEFRSLLINIKTRDEQHDGFNWWMSFNEQNVLPQPYFIPDIDEPVLEEIKSLWHSEKPYGQIHMSGNIKAEHDRRLFSETGLSELPDNLKEMMLSYKSVFLSIANMKNGFIEVADKDFISKDQANILQRYAKVFEQAYTRFLDLQKAEVQAREAQIELSLERVRAKTMAMHNSADVGETAAVMVDELKKLGIETIRCGIGIMHEPGDMEVWTISTGENNKTDIIIGWLDMHIHPLLHGAFKSWRNKNESYAYELKDDDLLAYYNAINSYPGYPIKYDISTLPKQIHHNEFAFAEGILFAFSLQQLTDEQRKIFKRFAGVFGQTYRRYLDLKKAETQAKEAQIEAALERVRSRTLAMQKSGELAETSAVLFKQLISLGIKPNRLYISIMKDDNGETEFWITDEDGSKVSMAYEDNLNNNPSFKKMFDGWKQQKKSLVIDMKGKVLKEYFNYLSSIHVPFKGGLTQKRRLQYIAYFSKGFIGMASPDEQPAETLQLLERFAYVFNLTFTRFNDLQIAEAHAVQAEHDLIEIKAARKKAEDTLSELQVTQKQLVQSEKMASLGELTAGIAHEIQNPLNFVNNFSEVSKELLDEMKAELETGNKELATELANDIIQNLEKINHHGKRADAIVKGMLQHSRKSSGHKEPTEINALCDEYLRLSYHGLRAKDKSFNADFKTEFDESIGKINIVPQDIGRVLLNLINNAFYAVSEKQKTAGETYKPLVTVATKSHSPLEKGWVEVIVSDNGNGIPSNIIDKIFQPFFTTKPTGQGTGLGLSLAYDIITKEHSGSIKGESIEGEGSTFIINLPVAN